MCRPQVSLGPLQSSEEEQKGQYDDKILKE